MTSADDAAVLVDGDNTLFDNDLVQDDLRDHLAREFDDLPRQGHYALDPDNIIAYPSADLTVERIGDVVNHDLSALPGAPRAGRPWGEQP